MVIAYLIGGLGLLVGALFIGRWFVSAEPRQVLHALRWTAAILGTILIGYFLVAGRQYLIAFLIPLLLPLLMRMGVLAQRFKAATGPRPGQKSTVESRYLRMTLEHETGAMDGTVLEGSYRGSKLSELELHELIDLWRTCRTDDEDAARLLEAYLDRAHGEVWRDAAGAHGAGQESPGGGGARGSSAAMSRDEALAILGLEEGASNADIRAAHRSLMQKLHPDHGGSTYLASKLNQAKELLLKKA